MAEESRGWAITRTALFAVLVLILAVRLYEPSMIYYPIKYPEGYWNPAAYGLSVEDAWMRTEDGIKIHGWFAKTRGASWTLLWAHGNAGNISHRLDMLSELVANVPANVLAFDYRGYGRSEGRPSEEGVYEDARAAYDYLVKKADIDPARIVCFGQSLGGAVVIDLAAHRAIAGIIAEATFSSASDMARRMLPIPGIGWIVRSRFDSTAKIRELRIPILFMHGNADEVVPFELGRRLFEAANEPKVFWEIPGATHNDTSVVGGQEYYRRITEFLESLPIELPADRSPRL